MRPGNDLQHYVACFEIHIFAISFISKDGISLQALCPIFVKRHMRFGQPISRSFRTVVPSYLVDLTCYSSLSSLLLAAFRALDSVASYGRSKWMIDVNESEYSSLRENKNVNIFIFFGENQTVLLGN
jgi:hypothetical protein